MRTPAVTLWRPWTACITDLPTEVAKRRENRGWATKHRGPIFLHAGVWFDADAFDLADLLVPGHTLPRAKSAYPTGIVAVAHLVGVCSASADSHPRKLCDCGPWAFSGQHHWQLANVRKLVRPVPCNGSQMLWMPPREVVDAVAAQLTETDGAT